MVLSRLMQVALFLNVCILTALFAGCSTAPPAGRADPIEHHLYPKIVVEEPLRRFLGVNYDAIIVRGPTDRSPLHVATPVRSLANTQMSIQYRYRWLDGTGRIIQDTGWRMTVLEPRLSDQLTANATQTAATDWRLEIRSAR